MTETGPGPQRTLGEGRLGTKVPSEATPPLTEYRPVTHSDKSASSPADGHTVPPRAARTWLKFILVAAVAGYALAIAGLAKANDKGGTGFQLLMVLVTGVVLLLALVVRRRAITSAAEEHGQHIEWLGFVRFGLTAAIVLAVIATARSTPQQQAFPAIIAAISLWLLTIVIRLDSAAHDAAAVGSTS